MGRSRVQERLQALHEEERQLFERHGPDIEAHPPEIVAEQRRKGEVVYNDLLRELGRLLRLSIAIRWIALALMVGGALLVLVSTWRH